MYLIETYSHVGDKLIIRLKPVSGSTTSVDVEIPAVIYNETRLKAAIEAALERRERD
jgi:hypothetical protein